MLQHKTKIVLDASLQKVCKREQNVWFFILVKEKNSVTNTKRGHHRQLIDDAISTVLLRPNGKWQYSTVLHSFQRLQNFFFLVECPEFRWFSDSLLNNSSLNINPY